jgi:hypothetical protein
MALGSSTGERELHVSGNSNSSSVRKMNVLHQTVAPHSRVVSTEVIQIRRLDDVAWTLVEPTSSLFLKLDVQGHEADVLEGAEQVLRRAAGLMVEMSLVELYEGQVLWRAMMDRLEAHGFRLWNLHPGFSDRAVGRTLQFDATLFRM